MGRARSTDWARLSGKVELNEFTLGLQFGGQSFSEIIFFKTKERSMSLPMERSRLMPRSRQPRLHSVFKRNWELAELQQAQEKVLLQRNKRIMAIAKALRYSFTLEAG